MNSGIIMPVVICVYCYCPLTCYSLAFVTRLLQPSFVTYLLQPIFSFLCICSCLFVFTHLITGWPALITLLITFLITGWPVPPCLS